MDIVYDTQGRAVSTLSTEGYFDDRFIYNDEEKCTTYLDAEGGETRYWYNEDGLVTLSIDPLGRAERPSGITPAFSPAPMRWDAPRNMTTTAKVK